MANLLAGFNDEDKARASEIANLLAGFNKEDKTRAAEIANLLAEFNGEDKARATEIVNLLAGFNEEDKARASEIAALMSGFKEHDKARAIEMANLISDFKKEREETAAAWKSLLGTMSSVRGAAPKKEAVPEKVIPEEAIPVTKPAEVKVKEEEKFPRRTEKERKILSIIKKNPEGITLPEIAYDMGVAFVTITKDVKKMLQDGLIKKVDNRYFLV